MGRGRRGLLLMHGGVVSALKNGHLRGEVACPGHGWEELLRGGLWWGCLRGGLWEGVA